MAAFVYRGGKIFFSSPLRQRQDVIASASASVTLTKSQSGANFLFDRASGVTYNLPAPTKVGLYFGFLVTVSVTSNNHKIVTDSPGVTLLIGSVWETVAAGTGTQFFPNGTTNSAITMTGTTAGGLINTYITVVSVNSTTWQIDGTVMASGVVVTPFTNS